jgi:hypothetical protein
VQTTLASRRSSLETVELNLEEYKTLHQDVDTFVIVAGHPCVKGEVILLGVAGFEQVQKRH